MRLKQGCHDAHAVWGQGKPGLGWGMQQSPVLPPEDDMGTRVR
jgi:hypothetical protein